MNTGGRSVTELRRLASTVAEALGVDTDAIVASKAELSARDEQRNRALRIAVYIAINHMKFSEREVGESFGGRSASNMRATLRALQNDLIMVPALGGVIEHIAASFSFRPIRSESQELLDAAVEAAERALEAGLDVDLRERIEPLLRASAGDR